jgi:two-component system sensor histidine kinase PilS (NtrC family)
VSDADGQRSGERTPVGSGVKWLIGLRLLIAFLFLGSAAILALRDHPPFSLKPLFVLVALTCFLSLVYLLLLRRWPHGAGLCGMQLWIDVVLVTGLVHFTGGIDSLFAFVYIFPILGAAMLVSRRTSLVMAAAGSVLYGALITVQFHGLAAGAGDLRLPIGAHDPGYALFQVFVHTIAFLLVALLGSHLAERLKQAGRELEEQRTDLRDLQTLHRDIIANIPSGIVTIDLEGRIVSLNAGAEKILGVGAADVLNRRWQDAPLRGATRLDAVFSDPGPVAEAWSQEVEVRRPDGTVIPVEVSLAPLRSSDGALIGVVGVVQDLTERRQAEARLRRADRLAAVGQLAAGLAHEVRNPLAAISGSIQLLKEEGASTRAELLDIILGEAERLKLVTGQFLEFARPTLTRERACDLVAMAGEAISILRRGCERERPLTIALEADAERVLVAADAEQLNQVFWNLGLNAIQAMPAGGTLTVAVRRQVPGNGPGWAALEFRDTGPGIAPSDVGHIFDPFYTTKPGGTGLGLAIARKIVESFGGRIDVVTEEGKGATFTVLLKRVPAEARAA